MGNVDSGQVAELRARISGVLTALVTPYDRGGEISRHAIGEHVEHQVAGGVTGIVPGSTMGEFTLLTVRERRLLLEETVAAVRGRVLVLANISDSDGRRTIELGTHAAEAGADGALVMLPPFFKLHEDEQYEYFRWISQRIQVPMVIYASENVASERPSIALLERLLGLGCVAGLKEAVQSWERATAIVSHFGASLPLIAAAESALRVVLPAGASATLTATSCFSPRTVGAILRGDHEDDGARDAYASINAFRTLFAQDMEAGYPAYLPWTKAACELIGLPTGPPRHPIAPLNACSLDRLATVIDRNFN